MPASDAEILKLYHEDEQKEKAFRLLVAQYTEPLYFLIRRYVHSHQDADDILQNTFIKIWKALPEFRAEAMLLTWMYRIATNEALQFVRQRRLETQSLEDSAQFLRSDPFFDGDEAQLKLELAVQQLPEKQKTVFILKYFQDLTYDQIAEITDTSVGALKASYHHAVKKIEENLTGL